MKKRILAGLAIGLLIAGMAGGASATLIQISAVSARSGELGWFVVDDATLEADFDKVLAASQFIDYSWHDPESTISINPEDVPSDNGSTKFSYFSEKWTVKGGIGQVLEDNLGNGVSTLGGDVTFSNVFGSNWYKDVTWSTTDYCDAVSDDDRGTAAPVPEPATIILFSSGLVGLAGFVRKKIKN